MPTSTTQPTSTSSPVPTSTPAVQQTWNGVVVCSGHDTTVWHRLVERDAAGGVTCTYLHHHGDDPSAVDAIFGTAGNFWGAPGHAIGYPWLSSPVENTEKHELFKLIVRAGMPKPARGPYIRNLRSWTHSVGSGGYLPGVISRDGFQVQTHSFATEVEICRETNVCGILRVGGLQDTGIGILTGNTMATDICAQKFPVLNPMNLTAWDMLSCSEQYLQLQQPRHMHGQIGGNRRDFTWYSDTAPSYRRTGGPFFNVGFGTIGEAWAPVDPTDYNALPFYDVNAFNGGYMSQEILSFSLGSGLPGYSSTTTDYTGAWWLDKWGNYLPTGACSAPSTVCMPLVMEHVPAVSVAHRDTIVLINFGLDAIQHHDVKVNGKSMTRYPN